MLRPFCLERSPRHHGGRSRGSARPERRAVYWLCCPEVHHRRVWPAEQATDATRFRWLANDTCPKSLHREDVKVYVQLLKFRNSLTIHYNQNFKHCTLATDFLTCLFSITAKVISGFPHTNMAPGWETKTTIDNNTIVTIFHLDFLHVSTALPLLSSLPILNLTSYQYMIICKHFIFQVINIWSSATVWSNSLSVMG